MVYHFLSINTIFVKGFILCPYLFSQESHLRLSQGFTRKTCSLVLYAGSTMLSHNLMMAFLEVVSSIGRFFCFFANSSIWKIVISPRSIMHTGITKNYNGKNQSAHIYNNTKFTPSPKILGYINRVIVYYHRCYKTRSHGIPLGACQSSNPWHN